jgi:hypothetical protein
MAALTMRWFETALRSARDGLINVEGVVHQRFREFERVACGVRSQPSRLRVDPTNSLSNQRIWPTPGNDVPHSGGDMRISSQHLASLVRRAREFFGSWKQALQAAGVDERAT